MNDEDETLLFFRRLRAVLKVQKMLIFVAFVGNYSSAFSARMDVTNSKILSAQSKLFFHGGAAHFYFESCSPALPFLGQVDCISAIKRGEGRAPQNVFTS